MINITNKATKGGTVKNITYLIDCDDTYPSKGTIGDDYSCSFHSPTEEELEESNECSIVEFINLLHYYKVLRGAIAFSTDTKLAGIARKELKKLGHGRIKVIKLDA